MIWKPSSIGAAVFMIVAACGGQEYGTMQLEQAAGDLRKGASSCKAGREDAESICARMDGRMTNFSCLKAQDGVIVDFDCVFKCTSRGRASPPDNCDCYSLDKQEYVLVGTRGCWACIDGECEED